MSQMLQAFIQNIVNRLIEAGFTNPTEEDISCKFQSQKIKFRLYSQEQWDTMISSKSTAVQIFSQRGISYQPDAVVTHKDKVYLVKLINKE